MKFMRASVPAVLLLYLQFCSSAAKKADTAYSLWLKDATELNTSWNTSADAHSQMNSRLSSLLKEHPVLKDSKSSREAGIAFIALFSSAQCSLGFSEPAAEISVEKGFENPLKVQASCTSERTMPPYHLEFASPGLKFADNRLSGEKSTTWRKDLRITGSSIAPAENSLAATANYYSRATVEQLKQFFGLKGDSAIHVEPPSYAVKALPVADNLSAKARGMETEEDEEATESKPRVIELFFGFGETHLSRKQLSRLKGLKISRGTLVFVEGYSDSTGPAGVNYDVSAERARYVTAILKRRFPGATYRMKIFGEKSPGYSNRTRAGRAANRRVVVRIRSK